MSALCLNQWVRNRLPEAHGPGPQRPSGLEAVAVLSLGAGCVPSSRRTTADRPRAKR
jgi:hypothetical protein